VQLVARNLKREEKSTALKKVRWIFNMN
jgi:hypothetical protein